MTASQVAVPRPARIPLWRILAALAAVLTLTAGLVTTMTAPASAQAADIDTNASYVLENRHSGLVADVLDASTADGAELIQWNRTDQPWQQFRFVPSGDGYYRIVAQHSGKALDVWEWSTEDGAEIRQYTDHGGANQQWLAEDVGDGYVQFVNRHSGKALEVWEWSQNAGDRLSQFSVTSGANQHWRLIEVDGDGGNGNGGDPGDGPVGWASQNGGTTGGAGGDTVTVSSAGELTNALTAAGPLTIQVQGTINLSGMNDIGSDKTLIGLGNATITGGGIDVDEAHNVIITNLTFRDWGDDAINMQDASTNVWVHHNTFTNGDDGAVDIKRETDYVTVAWNHFHNHDKTMLLGHSDSHTADIGHLRVTYHHNYFDGTDTRHPRVRFSEHTHVFNNYYRDNAEYGVASTMDANVLVEGNYFQDVDHPTHVGYASSGPGNLVERDNIYDNSGTPETAGSVANPPYGYSLDPAANIPSIVSNGAGAGN